MWTAHPLASMAPLARPPFLAHTAQLQGEHLPTRGGDDASCALLARMRQRHGQLGVLSAAAPPPSLGSMASSCPVRPPFSIGPMAAQSHFYPPTDLWQLPAPAPCWQSAPLPHSELSAAAQEQQTPAYAADRRKPPGCFDLLADEHFEEYGDEQDDDGDDEEQDEVEDAGAGLDERDELVRQLQERIEELEMKNRKLLRRREEQERNRKTPAQEVPPQSAVGQPTQNRRIDLLHDVTWVTKDSSKYPVCREKAASTAPREQPTILFSLQGIWTKVFAGLPAPECGCGQHTQFFGLLFGTRDVGGMLRLEEAELCPDPFVWNGSADLDSRRDLLSAMAANEEHLYQALRNFMSTRFGPWAASFQDRPGVAWLVCNDGEAFAMSKALLEFGQLHQAEQPWRGIVAVADRAKSTQTDAALELLSLGSSQSEPDRLVYDVCGDGSDGVLR